MELMATAGFQEEGEAAGKWRRACLTSAQLSTYFVGYTELSDLFARTRARLTIRRSAVARVPPPRLLGSLVGGSSVRSRKAGSVRPATYPGRLTRDRGPRLEKPD